MDDFTNNNGFTEQENGESTAPNETDLHKGTENTVPDETAPMADADTPNFSAENTQDASAEGGFAEENPAESNAEPQQADFGVPPYTAGQNGSFGVPPQNKIHYSDVLPVKDYKPMSRGLKIFAVVLAAVLLLTGAAAGGYFLGERSGRSGSHRNATVNLAAKPADTDELTAAQVYDKTSGSVVGITVYNTAGNGAQASGVIYSSDGYIVTNDHIYSEVPAPKFKIYTADGKEYDAKYVAGDQISDLAVLKMEGSGFQAAQFGDSAQMAYGENVVAIGRPSDATHASSITKGIISSAGVRIRTANNYFAKMIQTDSAINPGSSGGALVNMYGQVIGITSAKIAGVNYDAVGYAIPTQTMKRICEELIKEGKVVSRAKLGISYQAIDSVTAEIGEHNRVGLYVASVSEDSDLYGKLKEGDVITHINGTEVSSDDVVLDIIENSVAGDKVSLTVVTSGGKTATYDAVLKANIGESSYTTEYKQNNNSSDGNSSGGTFDFPFGE